MTPEERANNCIDDIGLEKHYTIENVSQLKRYIADQIRKAEQAAIKGCAEIARAHLCDYKECDCQEEIGQAIEQVEGGE